jgi:hypothetical protein
MKLSDMFGEVFARLPLKKAPHIHVANALRTNWADVLPAEKCSYILGNPPFIGHHLQTPEQKQEMQEALSDIQASGVMDYISAWFMNAAKYIKGTSIKAAFVSTNSITQGEQVGILWSVLSEKYGVKINFAHRTFKWTIDEKRAAGMKIAAVYVVIIGFSNADHADCSLFEYETVVSEPHIVKVKNINAYLADAPNIFIINRATSICDVPQMLYGSKPTDGGHFLFTNEEKQDLLRIEPEAEKFIRPFISAREYLCGEKRWVLWLVDAEPHEIKNLPEVLRRIEKVKKFRSESKAASTRNYPFHNLFRQVTQPKVDYILVPRTTSENRQYIPMGFFNKNSIVSDTCQAIPNATPYHFGILTSAMHMAWVSATCGRLEGRYRYSKDIVYNNFPWPDVSEKQQADIAAKAQAVLDARKEFPQSSLADLYDPNTMPPSLRKAHDALDRAVDKAYRASGFKNERERVEFLFNRYLELTEPLTAAHAQSLAQAKTKSKRTRRKD